MYHIATCPGGYDSDITEILNFDTLTWRLGPSLPSAVNGGGFAPFEDSFVVAGGYGDYFQDTIYQYDPANEVWITREEKLAHSRYFTAAAMVPDDMVECV